MLALSPNKATFLLGPSSVLISLINLTISSPLKEFCYSQGNRNLPDSTDMKPQTTTTGEVVHLLWVVKGRPDGAQ
jgi:hypothetical protein